MIAHLEMLSGVGHDSNVGETSDPFVWPNLGAIEHTIRELKYNANHLPDGDNGEMTQRKCWFAMLYQQAAYELYVYVVRVLRQCGINRSRDEIIECRTTFKT